jgi:hypothetical protein
MLDELPVLPELRTVHQFSSHNKEGRNGDAGWHLYDDERGDAVIFDVEGPGCIRSMWSTAIHEEAVFKFFFDGEKEPRFRISMLDFYKGEHELFPPPLVSYERRGRWGDNPYAGNSFVPVPFAGGLRITVEGPLEFYHILYEKYPHGSRIETFTGKEDRSRLLRAFENMGETPYALGEVEVIRIDADAVDAGGALDLVHLNRSGCIRRIVLEAEGTDAFIQENMIQMKWDGHTHYDVQAPVGFFFGSAVHATELRTLPMAVEKLDGGRVRLTSWFPMPFFSEALIRLVNRSSTRLDHVKAEVAVGPPIFATDRAGYFTTLFREGTTTYGRDWLFCETPGTGWFVGVVQSMKGEHYCEGDEHFHIDGAISPQINGTGSEDYYLGCFWPNTEFNSPFANCVGDIQEQGGGTFDSAYGVASCYSRFHLEAPVPFYSHLDARIQHGGASHILSSYASLAFYYLRRRPALVQSDYINVGNTSSEDAHRYRATRSKATGPVEGHPEGHTTEAVIREQGRRHEGGEISFTVAVDPENRGVRLRRRLDQGSPRQTARVYINGERVGTWYHPDHNGHLRWFDSDFDIHPRFTQGKKSLDVRLVVHAGGGRGLFTDFCYQVFSFNP